MTNGDFQNLDEVEDIESHNVYAMAKSLHLPHFYRWKMIQRTSRDNGRTPMQWSAETGAGFTTGTPWLKINQNHEEINVALEEGREDGVLAFWRYMISLRKSLDVLMDGDFTPLYEGKTVYAFARATDDDRVIAIFNMSAKTTRMPKTLLCESELLASNYDTIEDTLRPFEFRLIRPICQ